MVSWATHEAIDVCREACGGHGYSAINQLAIGELREDHDVWKTFEGG
jgi:acyl-CoA oxidase